YRRFTGNSCAYSCQGFEKCPLHAGLPLNSHWTVLQDENPRKNHAMQFAKTQLGLTDEQMVQVTWNYDSSRLLHMHFSFLTGGQRNNLQTFLNTQLGTGKVKVEA